MIKDKDHKIKLNIFSNHSEFAEMVDEVYNLLQYKGNKNRAKEHLNMLLCNLYLQYKIFPEYKISYDRNQNKYNTVSSRYNPLKVSREILLRLIDNLYELEFVDKKNGNYNHYQPKACNIARLWGIDKLHTLFSQYNLRLSEINPHPKSENIILKTSKTEKQKPRLTDYKDNSETKQMRELLKKYNKLLQNTNISIREGIDVKNKKGVSPNYNDKFVKRVFNNNSFELGGRFYGGWWQNIKDKGEFKFRQHILIDGSETIELDYSAIHIYLAAHNEAQKVEAYPYYVNLYNIDELKPEIPKDIIKIIIKTIILIGVNAKDKESGFKAIRKKLYAEMDETSINLYFPNKLTNELIERIFQRIFQTHPFLQKYLCSAKGLELQYLDSKLAEFIILKFVDMNKPILGFHDGFRVKQEDKHLLKETMEQAYKTLYNSNTPEIS